jgi:hypothetical protein
MNTLLPAALKQVLQKELTELDQTLERLNKKRDAIHQLLAVYEGEGETQPRSTRVPRAARSGTGAELNTVEMARTVIRNLGRPMHPKAIADAIHRTYGIQPAKTLSDMLWKRARAGKGFYKTDDGEIGVTALQSHVETVKVSNPAA